MKRTWPLIATPVALLIGATIMTFTSTDPISGPRALNIGYADVGPGGGRPVVLLHGWPYDIHSYVDVAPLLASADYRVIRESRNASPDSCGYARG